METEEERRAILENDAATKREDGSYQHSSSLDLIKGVVNVGVVFSLKPVLKVGNYAYHSNLMF